jgi:hypothetical protein
MNIHDFGGLMGWKCWQGGWMEDKKSFRKKEQSRCKKMSDSFFDFDNAQSNAKMDEC